MGAYSSEVISMPMLSHDRPDENQETYVPLEPNRAVALTMNFPQSGLPGDSSAALEQNDRNDESYVGTQQHLNQTIVEPNASSNSQLTSLGPVSAPFAAFGMIIRSALFAF